MVTDWTTKIPTEYHTRDISVKNTPNCKCWKCQNLEIERLHEGFRYCEGCEGFFLGTFDIKVSHNQTKDLCVTCIGRMDIKSYMVLEKTMTKRDLFIHETNVYDLPLELVKTIEFVSQSIKDELIEYLEKKQ